MSWIVRKKYYDGSCLYYSEGVSFDRASLERSYATIFASKGDARLALSGWAHCGKVVRLKPKSFPKSGTPITDTIIELKRARELYEPFNSPHEGWATLLEEVEELWDEVKKKPSKRSKVKMRGEAIQVAAMALRFVEDCCE